MTLAVVIATESVEGAVAGRHTRGPTEGPAATAGLAYGDGFTLLQRLLDQLAALNVHDSHIITRPDLASALRDQGHGPGDPAAARHDRPGKPGHEIVESQDLAMDLREIARLADAAKEPMLILHGDIVMNDEQMVRLIHDARPGSDALALIGERRFGRRPIRPLARTKDGHIISAGSRHHQVTEPDAEFRGVLRIAPKITAELAAAAKAFADLVGMLPERAPIRTLDPEVTELDWLDDAGAGADVTERAPQATSIGVDLGGTPPRGDDAPALLLVGLVRSGVRVAARPVRGLVCDRVLTAEQVSKAHAAVGTVDEDRMRLDAAVKEDDGFFTTYAVSPYSRFIARWAACRHVTPNMVTSISMGVAVVAAAWFSAGTRLGLVLGAVLLYVAFVLDCVDGQLARYTRQYSTLGAWLDAIFDRAKEYVVYAGLAMGSTAAAVGSLAHGGEVWGLAVAALILQTVRHMIDFSFQEVMARTSAAPLPLVPLAARDDSALDAPPYPPSRPTATARRAGGLGHLAVRPSTRTESRTESRTGGNDGFRWVKKVMVLPIGERFALISISAALSNAKVTFLLLLVWGSLATAYALARRVPRSFAR